MASFTRQLRRFGFTALACAVLASCGGGGSSDSSNNNGGAIGVCSIADEKQRFLNYMRDDYFWYRDIPTTVNLAAYADSYALLEGIRSNQDRFSFLLTEQEYQERFVNAEFIGFGFGTRVENQRVFINYVFDESPAERAGIARGDELVSINGTAVTTLIQQGTYNTALGPNQVGASVTLEWRKPNNDSFSAVVSKERVETNTVLATEVFTVDNKQVGYYVLNSFINRTGADLNSAYDQLVGVDELIIDVRYNGGGLIRYANQAGSQAAGNNVIGNIFTRFIYNDKNSASNVTELFQLYDGVRQLNLQRVYVLTTAASCSSSELIINSLEPFVDVVVIGGRTCGKPVGQSPRQICDKRTFVVNFETVNANGDGRYFDGIPADCQVADVLVGDWGVSNDPLLVATRNHITTGSCQAVGTQHDDISARVLQSDAKPQRVPTVLDQWQREF
ncbi:MAG: Carboxy-terminal processing protease CtpB [Pseudidiomarina mangrovi]|nr:MAG: Carboxy-terminal processing protease CtpB [Pseudidiomarina mangrovi]